MFDFANFTHRHSVNQNYFVMKHNLDRNCQYILKKHSVKIRWSLLLQVKIDLSIRYHISKMNWGHKNNSSKMYSNALMS